MVFYLFILICKRPSNMECGPCALHMICHQMLMNVDRFFYARKSPFNDIEYMQKFYLISLLLLQSTNFIEKNKLSTLAISLGARKKGQIK